VEKEMKLSLDLTDSTDVIVQQILENLKKEINNTFNKAIPKITDNIKDIIKQALISEPEYSSLKAGTLRAEFGIEFPENIDRVIDALVSTLEVQKSEIRILRNGLSGGFSLTMIKKDDISGVIYTDIASVIDNKGYVLPWLEWLLLKGNEVLVKNYSVNYTSSSRSRSGMALMVKSDRGWRVPPNFTGSENNNWITRAVKKSESQIISAIKNNIENYL
jgi:hypothetical protein